MSHKQLMMVAGSRAYKPLVFFWTPLNGAHDGSNYFRQVCVDRYYQAGTASPSQVVVILVAGGSRVYR